MTFDRPFPLALLVFAGMALTLGGAWAFQLAGYVPCELCLQQREGYYLGLPLAALGAAGLAFGWPACAWRGLLAATALCLLSTLALGTYHAGAEWAFWPGPVSCGAAANALPASADNLLNSLASTRPPSCTEAAGRFLGLSFAGWNVVAASVMALLAFRAATLDTLPSRASATT